MRDRLRVLTWHVHGSYLRYLAEVADEIVVPMKPGRPARYGGRSPDTSWPDGLVEVPAEEVAGLDLDLVVFQAPENYTQDQEEILSPAQRRLPRIYLEHDPPGAGGGSCFSTRHVVDDPDVLLVHVTHFNDLMWDAGRTPTRVIDHGVPDRGLLYRGDLPRGIVVVNDLGRRGRRLGADVVERVRSEIPLDIVGMASEEVGGLGEVPHDELPLFESRYRFFFHPIRYTSLGLALCEAMMAGMPVAVVATAEAATLIEDGVSGISSTDVGRLVEGMRNLLADPDAAVLMGREARKVAKERFGLERFVAEWEALFREVAGKPVHSFRPRASERQVDVLIPTRDRPAALAATLTSLVSQTHRAFRVVISDQGEDAAVEHPGVAAAVRLLEASGRKVEVVRNLPRRGMAQQRQFLLDLATAPHVWYLDDDVVVSADLLERLLAAIEREGCGFVGSAVIGLSHADDHRPDEEAVELWEGRVQPEVVRPGEPAWERFRLHNAANLFHVQERLGLRPEDGRVYKVAWVGGCVLFDREALEEVGGFAFHPELPPEHCGEDVVAQLRVMERRGGCGLIPSGAFHQEYPTTIEERHNDAPHLVL